MADVFISYARSTETQARQIAEVLRRFGFDVWRDDSLPAHRPYGEVIQEQLQSAKAVLVLWSPEAVKSHWVRAEADWALTAGTLVQVSLDGTLPPMPFNQVQCPHLRDWAGEESDSSWHTLRSSITALASVGPKRSSSAPPIEEKKQPTKLSICVLPFANMSGDVEQEYFSDGISEDIITDLSKISSLSVVSRNTAFTFKGKAVDVQNVARQLSVSHVVEGSVRKAGNRVRITGQLVDGEVGDHLWADRWDRELNDIFAVQDEITSAIVDALKLRLLPKERAALAQRGTTVPEAYDLYLLARQLWISGNEGDSRREYEILRICREATELDPGYANAFALMALVQTELRFRYGEEECDGVADAERALALNPSLAEAHAVRARYFADRGLEAESQSAIAEALRLDPESWEVNREAGTLAYRDGRIEDAIPYFEKATALMSNDFFDPGFLAVCYTALGRTEAARHAARRTVERVKAALEAGGGNGAALAHGVYSLACLGDFQLASEWSARAIEMDGDNLITRYRLACAQAMHLGDVDTALDLLEPYFAGCSASRLRYAELDPDMDVLRGKPRYRAMTEAAQARVSRDGPKVAM